MAENGNRIPAWRRLGLALKNETQPGITAPELSASHEDQQRTTPYDGRNGSHNIHQSPIEPAVNGKSPKLGNKRKHQHEAEEDGQTPKRGKTSLLGVNSNEDAATEASAFANANTVEVETTSSEQPSAADASQPKGDPNYRKKKAKPRNKRRNPEDGQAGQAPAQKDATHNRSSLSPGADAPAPKKGRRTLLASTETDNGVSAPATTLQQHLEASGSTKDPSGSPSGIDRRKSVTFTPDTKRLDGHSAQSLFKKWAADQKGVNANSSLAELEERAQFLNDEAANNAKEKAKTAAAENSTKTNERREEPTAATAAQSTTSNNPKGKKKDPSLYTSYLAQYHTDRDNWKFNKAKQNDVIDNAVNIFRIPEEYSEALLEYVQGLKGAGAIELLRSKCETALEELDKEHAKQPAMDDRQAMQDEAMQARIAQERKRRKVEGDIEALSSHPHSDNFIRRLRRKRAEALLVALGRTSPILPATQTNSINPLVQHVAPKRDSKKRKRRGDVSSDESSSDSSSSDEDSSSSESDSDGSSSSEAGSGSDSGSDAGSGKLSEDEDESDSD